jgi:hypothetical protein
VKNVLNKSLRETQKMHFYGQYTFSANLAGFKIMKQKGANSPDLLHYAYISKLSIFISFKIKESTFEFVDSKAIL